MLWKLLSLICVWGLLAVGSGAVNGQPPVQKPAPPPAQPANPAGQQANPGGQTSTQTSTTGKTEPGPRAAPAGEYTFALIATLGILVIVCMPSRKR